MFGTGNKKLLISVGIAVLGAAIYYFSQGKAPGFIAPTSKADVAAEVNGEKILKKDLKRRAEVMRYFYTNISPLSENELAQLDNKVLEDFIQEKLLAQVLAQHGLAVSDDEVRQRIQELSVDREFGGDWAKYEQELKDSYHTTLEEVMRTVRLDILKEKSSQLKTKKHVFAIWVEKNVPQFVAYESMTGEMRAQHEKANQEKKQKAEAALARIRGGEDFVVVTRAVSEHKESVQNGGDLGLLALPTDIYSIWKPEDSPFPIDVGFFQALGELGAGEAKLYEGFTGYFIVKITEVQEGPVGIQSFDEWYQDFRARANVVMF